MPPQKKSEYYTKESLEQQPETQIESNIIKTILRHQDNLFYLVQKKQSRKTRSSKKQSAAVKREQNTKPKKQLKEVYIDNTDYSYDVI